MYVQGYDWSLELAHFASLSQQWDRNDDPRLKQPSCLACCCSCSRRIFCIKVVEVKVPKMMRERKTKECQECMSLVVYLVLHRREGVTKQTAPACCRYKVPPHATNTLIC